MFSIIYNNPSQSTFASQRKKMSLSERVRGLSNYITIISDDAALLETGRKSRSPAIRKNLSILQKECASLRKQCLETQKALPTKSRPPKVVDALQSLNTQALVEVSSAPQPSPAASLPSMLKLKRVRATKRAVIQAI